MDLAVQYCICLVYFPDEKNLSIQHNKQDPKIYLLSGNEATQKLLYYN